MDMSKPHTVIAKQSKSNTKRIQEAENYDPWANDLIL